MYDTVNIWMPNNGLDESKILQSLDNISTHEKDDQVYYSGNLGNYKVTLNNRAINLKGSLAKYFKNDHSQSISKSDSKMAFESMADCLHIPIFSARITRFDIAANLVMNNPPEVYFGFLGKCDHYIRSSYKNSIYYQNSKKELVFYNKSDEIKSKKNVTFNNIEKNLLRYEQRYMKRIAKQHKKQEITPLTLVDNDFYIDMINNWVNEYEKICKDREFVIDYTRIKSPKDFEKLLIMKSIHDVGLENLLDEVEILKKMRCFSNPVAYCRTKNSLKKLSESPKLTTKSELVEELDEKIKEVRQHELG